MQISFSLLVDLVVLEFTNFDVILGIDWLLANYATLDCRNKVVNFRRPEGSEVVLLRNQMPILRGVISTMQAKKLLRKGC